MAISDTISSIEDNIRADYEGLTNLGIDLTNINKNIENIKPCLDTIYNSLPKVSDTGTEVTLSPTLKGKLGIVEKGNSTQESTTGNQLWKPYNLTKNNQSGINWVTSIDGTITASGTATANSLSASSNELTDYFVSLPAGTYTISGGTEEVRADVINSSGTRIKMTSGTDNFTLSETTLVQVRALVPNGTALTGTKTIKPMLNSGSTALAWEKYTGGIPAPNPSYSFPIKSVTGNNNVVVRNSDNTQSQTLPLNLGNIELNKIGTYQDYIYKNNDKWYKHNAIRKLELTIASMDNNEDYPGWKNQTQLKADFSTGNTTFYERGSYYLCNVCTQQNSNNDYIQFNADNNSTLYLRKALFGSDFTQTYWKTNFPNLVFQLYYSLPAEKQEDIEITDTQLIEQLENIDKVKGYNGTTIITSTYDSNNAQMILEVSSLKGE